MKSVKLAIVAIIVLFVAMMFIEIATPRHFVWDPTFTHNDDNPFGAALFDSVMQASLPQGYTTTSLTVSQLEKAIPEGERHVYMINTDNFPLSSTDELAMMRMLARGDQFLVAASQWASDTIERVVGFYTAGYSYVWIKGLKNNVLERDHDTLQWLGRGTQYPARQWIVPDELCNASVSNISSRQFKPLVTCSHFMDTYYDWDPATEEDVVVPEHQQLDTVAAVITYKRGKIVAVTLPLMFTNYGVVECDVSTLVMRLLSQLDRYPVMRLDPNAKTEAGGVSESPLRYVLDQPPMKWAVWLTLLTVLLAMVFTARRRQRVIPVIEPPVNRTLEMVKHIGSLYFHRHDNADLLTKKYQFFVDEVRRLTMIDLNDDNHIDDAYLQLQQASGIPRDELRQQLQTIVGWTAEQPTDRTLMRCIDYLNHVLSKLK